MHSKFRVLKEIAAGVIRRPDDTPRKRADEHLPFRLEIGSYVTFSIIPFLSLNSLGSLIAAPEGALKVVGIGKVTCGGDTMYRFYFSDEISMLQIALNQKGEVYSDEILFFQQVEELVPGTSSNAGDWSVWLGDLTENSNDTFLIGYETFQRMNSDLVYTRMIQMGGPAQIAPNTHTEMIHDDPYGQSSMVLTHHSMEYGRPLLKEGEEPTDDTPTEWLTVSAVRQGEEHAWVEMNLGIALTQEDFTVA